MMSTRKEGGKVLAVCGGGGELEGVDLLHVEATGPLVVNGVQLWPVEGQGGQGVGCQEGLLCSRFLTVSC